MSAVFLAFAWCVGSAIGSFLNVCILRWPKSESVVRPRSRCPKCGAMIAWYDNIPLLSFLILGAKCRNCQQSIPWRYPIVEACTAIAFALCVFKLGVTLVGVKYAILSAILITLVATDLEDRILPDEFTLGGALLGLLFSPFVHLERYLISVLLPYRWGLTVDSIAESIFGAVVGGGSIWLIAYLYQKYRHKEGLGLGDVKMIVMLGAFLGLRYALQTLILASVLGAVVGMIFIAATKKDSKTYELPFGTFLGATALILVMLGEVFASHAQ